MKLLIGTINALVLYNGQQNIVTKGNYYGVTWDKNYIYASRNPYHNPISVIDVFTKSLRKIAQLYFSIQLNNVHQILVIDGHLHITYTAKDRIIVYNLHSKKIRSYNWTGEKADRCHLNSIWAKDGKIYVVESGLGGKKCPPAIQILSKEYQSLAKVYVHTRHIHNVYIENDAIHTCAHEGIMKDNILIDLRQNKENGFFRGMARTEENWIIGESQVLPREKRSFGDANILVLDNNFKIVDDIALKDTGQIQDIRVIDELDLAHNRVPF